MVLHSVDVQTVCIFLSVFLAAYVFFNRKKPIDFHGCQPPTLKTVPILGSLPYMPQFETMHFWFKDQLPTMGGVIGCFAMSKFMVILQTREALNQAFVKQSNIFASRPQFYVSGLINPKRAGIAEKPLNDSFKKNHRQSLSILREFGFGNSSVMEVRINSEVEDLVAELKRLNSVTFNPKSLVNGSVFNVMASILFGHRFERSDPKLESWISYTHRFFTKVLDGFAIDIIPILRFVPKFKRHIIELTALTESILNFVQEMVDEVLSQEDDQNEESFIKSYVNENGRDQFDRDELRLILRDFIFAGLETSSTTVLWAIALLADHPGIQKRLHDEIDSVLGGDNDGSRPRLSAGRQLPSLADRTRLPYVEATILELMRFKTIVPMSVPRETTQESEVGGFTIPARTMIMPNLYAIHMDPTVWKDPETFRPDRFVNKAGKVIDKDKVIPFSIGKRSCLGEHLARQQIFLFLTGLLQNFEIKPPEGQNSLKCTEVIGITVSPSPYEVRFILRNKDL